MKVEKFIGGLILMVLGIATIFWLIDQVIA